MVIGYRITMNVSALVAAVSVVGISANSGDVGGGAWTISLLGIAIGLLGVVSAYSLGTRSQFASATHRQQDSLSRIRESFESLAGRDWMTGLDTFAEIGKQVARELSRSVRYDRTFSVMFVTPRFEGNLAALGSSHISAIEIYTAEILRNVLRLSDGIARRTDVFGFVALLPETDATGGQIAGRRVSDALKQPYRIGPWDDQAEMISLETEILSYPGDEVAIAERFGIDQSEPVGPPGKTLPPNP